MRTIKDLSIVSPDPKHVVLIDDKPDYAINEYVIGVPEYTQDVCITSTGLKEWMKQEIPTHADRIEAVFAANRASYQPNAFDFSCDDVLWKAGRMLRTIFPSIHCYPPWGVNSNYFDMMHRRNSCPEDNVADPWIYPQTS